MTREVKKDLQNLYHISHDQRLLDIRFRTKWFEKLTVSINWKIDFILFPKSLIPISFVYR